MTRSPLVLLLSLATLARAQGLTEPAPDARPPAAAPDAEAPPASTPGVTLPRGAVLEEVTGTVRAVDRKAHRITVDASGSEVKLSLDRNTMVYTAAGLGTVLDLVPGAQIKAGKNAESLAYWVQVRAPAAKGGAPSTPGQGTGPAGGAGAATTESGGGGAAGEAGGASGAGPGAGPAPGGAGPAPSGGMGPGGAPGP